MSFLPPPPSLLKSSKYMQKVKTKPPSIFFGSTNTTNVKKSFSYFPLLKKVNSKKEEEPKVEEDEEIDIFDQLIEQSEKQEKKEKSKIEDPIIRPSLLTSSSIEENKKKESLEAIEKKKKELEEIKIKEKKASEIYHKLILAINTKSTKLELKIWKNVFSFCDSKSLQNLAGTNTGFKKEIETASSIWENLFKLDFGGLKLQIKDLKTWYSKFVFMKSEKDIEMLELSLISTDGGCQNDNYKVDNMLGVFYESNQFGYNPYGGFGTQKEQRRKVHCTKLGCDNNVNIQCKTNEVKLITKASITAPDGNRFTSPINNALVWVSEEPFKPEEIKNISNIYNHILKEDCLKMIKNKDDAKAPLPDMWFFDLFDISKNSTAKERTKFSKLKKPKLAQYYFIKMLNKKGPGNTIDCENFSAFGLSKF